MSYITILGTVAAILTTGAFIPQVIKTIKTKSAKDLSTSTFLMIFVGTALWFIYGIANNDYPMIVANGLTSILAGGILFLKFTGK